MSGQELSDKLKNEHTGQKYGEATREVVKIFQREHHLEPSGEVDEPTASAINTLLRELGMLEQESAQRVVSGQVQREDGLPFGDGLVRAFHETGQSAIRLGEDTTDAEGRYTIRYNMLPEVTSIHLRVTVSGAVGQNY